MDTIRFIGRILPKAAKLTVTYPEFQWNEPLLRLSPTWRLAIFNGHLEAQCDVDRFEESQISLF
jgi:hypothetical protein